MASETHRSLALNTSATVPPALVKGDEPKAPAVVIAGEEI